jgi:7,8-dihydro-6-hydroxymethylpterin dimethyltransferase
VMQLSGGEPTLHPQFWDILDAAKARPIKHVMVNTNGIVLAQDKAFVARLAGYAPGVEVYLQFDSLRAQVHRELRGADLTRIRRQALDNLNEAGLSTTLVVTLKKGLNDGEIGEIIDFALQQPCVRGVTLQPIQDAGRVEGYDPRLHRLTVSEIRRRIAEQSRLFTLEDVVPVPCNPDTLAMAYAIKTAQGAVPLTRWLDPQTLVEGGGNTIVFERDPALHGLVKDRIFKLFSTNHSPESQANCLSELMCCLPLISAPSGLRYDNVFRVLIVQFMDAYSLDVRALKKSCIHFALPDGRLVPFESYNLLYRDGRRLEHIRAGIATDFARRRERTTIPLVPAPPSAA